MFKDQQYSKKRGKKRQRDKHLITLSREFMESKWIWENQQTMRGEMYRSFYMNYFENTDDKSGKDNKWRET